MMLWVKVPFTLISLYQITPIFETENTGWIFIIRQCKIIVALEIYIMMSGSKAKLEALGVVTENLTID